MEHDYAEFKEMLKNAISDKLPGVELDDRRILKRNNQEVDSIAINTGDNICPVIYPEGLYERFMDGASMKYHRILRPCHS